MIFVALGANLPGRFGPPRETLRAARAAMDAAGIAVSRCSRTWLTAPVPVSDQPWYHNEVAAVRTALSPFRLLEALQEIENSFGRVRTVRNAPRVLDLDLVAYDGQVVRRPELIVPHPRMHKRAFVLLPLREVAGGAWEHPVLGMTLDDLIANLPVDQKAVPMEGHPAAEAADG